MATTSSCCKPNLPFEDSDWYFEAGIRYYPNKKGICLLFIKTHFQVACRRFGYEEVMRIVDDTLIRYSDTPINTTEALIMAAMNKNIHLECIYFLIRRQPDILHKLLSSKQATTVTAMTVDNSTSKATTNNRDSEKRKRKREI
jgi:hypothetical protein